MNKKVYNKRLELLNKLGEVKQTKLGQYVIINRIKQDIQVVNTGKSITKGTIKKIGKITTYPKNYDTLIYLGYDNILKFKNENGWKTLTPNAIYKLKGINIIGNFDILKEMTLYGKKSEYLKNYDINFLQFFNFLKSFKSFKEVLIYLGITFEVDITVDNISKFINGYIIENKNSLLEISSSEILDTVKMLQRFPNYEQNNKKVKNIHDDLVKLINLEDINSKSDEIIKSPLYFKLKDKLEFLNPKFLLSERALFLEGLEMHHCVSTRTENLKNRLYFNFNWNNEPYTCELGSSWGIELKGKYNKFPPEELELKILNIYNYEH